MKLACVLPILVVILLLIAPASGSTKKISPGASVFIGETDIDISSALNGCREIGLWPDGTNLSAEPKTDIVLMPLNTADPIIYHYNFSPTVFTGYNGPWYCSDKSPHNLAFHLEEPRIAVKMWDLDHDTDATGKTVPFLTNVSYRIETNMGPALNYANRPGLNPTDSFYSVSMMDPKGRPVPLLYDGNAGNARTVILPFDAQPFLMKSPYNAKNMASWDHAARSARGEQLYPEGDYVVTAKVNLNGMQSSYRESGIDIAGKLTATGSITLKGKAVEPVNPVTGTPPETGTTVVASSSTAQPGSTPATPVMATPSIQKTTSIPVTKKTTYSPVPAGLSIIGLIAAGLLAMKIR